jgi:Ca2+-transporting ATPase
MWAILIGTIAGLFLILYTPLNGILKLAPLAIGQFFLAIGISAVSVLWYEIVKFSNHVTGPHMKGSRKR